MNITTQNMLALFIEARLACGNEFSFEKKNAAGSRATRSVFGR